MALACSGGGGGGGGNGPANSAPTWTAQPTSQNALRGSTVTFSAGATGTPNPTLQWRKGGVNLSGQTNGSLALPSVTVNDEGSYDVVASNAAGSITSSAATLTVEWAPVFSSQPAHQAVSAPAPATFTVGIDAKPSASFQWQSSTNGSTWFDISGATQASFTTGATSGTMHGTQYRCLASNSRGTTPSSPATLSVNVPNHTLTVTLGAGTTGTPNASNSYPAGTVVNYSYTAQAGYSNLVVRLDGTPVPAAGTVTMNGPHTLTTSATLNGYTVTFVAGAGGTITGNASQTVAPGGNCTAVTAVPNSGFSFTNWTGAGFTTSTSNPLTVNNVTQNLTITANFSSAPPVGVNVGNTALDFSGTNWDGATVSLSSLRGKVVLFDFSGVWCYWCKVEAPHLQAKYVELKAKGLEVITVLSQNASGGVSNQTDCVNWKNTYGLTFFVITDPARIYTNYGITGWPTNFIVDRNGVIKYKIIGADEPAIDAALAALLP
ncbi:MAG: redoxin domain-containing protein [Acidobacteria bacterium]|nr:redoxin domain-containing protein [Acidobacteriota bacterium]